MLNAILLCVFCVISSTKLSICNVVLFGIRILSFIQRTVDVFIHFKTMPFRDDISHVTRNITGRSQFFTLTENRAQNSQQ